MSEERLTTCQRCGEEHASDPGLHSMFRNFDMAVRREERARIREGLKEALKEVQSLTPGEGCKGDPFWDAARNMYLAALRVVRR